MKKFCLTLVLVFTILCTGCISQEQIDNLNNQLSTLQVENGKMKDEIKQLQKENEDLKNKPQNRFAKGSELEDNNQLEDALKEFNELISKYPSSNEAKQASSKIKEIQKKIDDNRKVEEIKVAEQNKLEKQKKQEAEKSVSDKARQIIRVTKLSKSKPNSASGVDLYIKFQNKSEKTIKYAYFTVVPYNAVGDVVSCSIRNESSVTVRVTGPITYGQTFGNDEYWEALWYNSTIAKVKLTKIEIEYTDGSTVTIDEDNIKYVIY